MNEYEGRPSGDADARLRRLPLGAGTDDRHEGGPAIEGARDLPFELETDLERRICADPEWQEGAAWGVPRPGHWEGAISAHIAEVLGNIDDAEPNDEDRTKLRLIAIVHDTFKYKVRDDRPNVGTNHHAWLARNWAERYIDDLDVLDVIELHDEAYNSWSMGARKGRWEKAEGRARNLIDRLGPRLALYLQFFRADNRTDSKRQEPLEWFERMITHGV
jgi:hypothetical protein